MKNSDAVISFYKENLSAFEKKESTLNKKIKQIMALRLSFAGLLVFFFFYGISMDVSWMLYVSGISLLAFISLLMWQNNLEKTLQFYKAQVYVYEEELAYLKKGIWSKNTGEEYINPSHPYTYDLDIFGKHSLFQKINRTKTYLGEKSLVEDLENPDLNTIAEKQDIIKEMATDVSFLQDLQAYAYLTFEEKEQINSFFKWLENKEIQLPRFWVIYSKISWLPFVLVLALIFIAKLPLTNLLVTIFVIHFLIAGIYRKKNAHQEKGMDKMAIHLYQYGNIFKAIEEKEWHSEGLKKLHKKILGNYKNASTNLFQLAQIFKRIENIENIFGNLILNGVFLYHIKSLDLLKKWHQEQNVELKTQMETWGKWEALLSLAIFHYNHPQYIFPEISEDHFTFEKLGHPLMEIKKMVTNSISFTEKPFVILTGSNMSGKSTFLRSIGVNTLLFNIGAPVFAQKAVLSPLPLYVSMRQTDSLSDNESYFYAEIKRLNAIKEALKTEAHFILLDEILRGTNSDDKTAGAIGLLEQLTHFKVKGIIATHDLEVCSMENQYNNFYKNYCFESQIKDGDLLFDYTLRSGICKNRSATFLMKKMGILPEN